MPIVGIACPCTGENESFASCIERHENYSCPCSVPIYMLYHYAQDSRSSQRSAPNTFSATELLQCPRTFRLQQENDVYMADDRLYNMSRGTWTHYMMASAPARDNIIREQRLYKNIAINGVDVTISGTPDEVNTERGTLVDYKTKDNLPRKKDAGHEAQFNIYAWLLRGGRIIHIRDGESWEEQIDVTVGSGGMHYLTWKTKKDKQFRKDKYPLWKYEQTEQFVRERAELFLMEDPPCSPYGMSPYWKCACIQLEQQLHGDVLDGIT